MFESTKCIRWICFHQHSQFIFCLWSGLYYSPDDPYLFFEAKTKKWIRVTVRCHILDLQATSLYLLEKTCCNLYFIGTYSCFIWLNQILPGRIIGETVVIGYAWESHNWSLVFLDSESNVGRMIEKNLFGYHFFSCETYTPIASQDMIIR